MATKKDTKLPWGLKSDKILPGSAKMISESKLKAFNIGAMSAGKKMMSKKEQEEIKKKQEEEEVGAVYKEFVEAFQDTGKTQKAWVKGGVVNPDEKINDSGPRLYKPKSKISETIMQQQALAQIKKEEEEKKKKAERPPLKKKAQEKKKSNLELFKEELRQMQQEREARHTVKSVLGVSTDSRLSRFEPEEPTLTKALGPVGSYSDASGQRGIINYDDDTTTNLYLGNINPKMTEQQLCELFGKYGPLASVKIMWPRSDEERQRGRNCGFVAFMNRKDGERCLNALRGKDVSGFEMKLGWGKAVPIPPHPVYIPPELVKLTLPPPQSGLPFNAQAKNQKAVKDLSSVDWDDETLANAVVKVVIPTERNLLFVIHRMIEFVVREGPMFEAMIMNREINNPTFRFLFENKSPAHIYYRWKMFSVLQGDNIYDWRTDDFCMFAGGSLWRPPPMNPYTGGMPQELIDKVEQEDQAKGQLNDSQRDRLEDVLRDLTPERMKVADAMVWCLDHAESAEEIVECITESLSILQTPMPKKIARLYLVSDLLHNSCAKVQNASFFRKYFECKLPEIFEHVRSAHESIDARLKAEQFKMHTMKNWRSTYDAELEKFVFLQQKVMNCFRAWEDWAIYPNELLIKLQNIFLGLVRPDALLRDDDSGNERSGDEDFDGIPMNEHMDEDLDGMPLTEDIDGIPFGSEDLRSSSKLEPLPAAKFVPSKWETVDEEELKAQVVTTSKWDLFDNEDNSNSKGGKTNSEDEDLDGRPMTESDGESPVASRSRGSSPERQVPLTEQQRAKLREVEVKVMKYQDELESGSRNRKSGMNIVEQVEKYRQKLMQKIHEAAERLERESSVKKSIRRPSSVREKEQEKSGKKNSGSKKRDRSSRRDRSSSSDEGYPTPNRDHRRVLATDSASNSPRSPPSSRRRNRSPLSSRDDYNSPPSLAKRRRSRSPRRKRSPSPYNRDSSRSPVRHKKHKKKH